VPSDTPAVAVEQRKPGWLIPPEWEFQSEVWEYERNPVPKTVYDHESEVGIIRE
jgi:hypothetical protein